MQKLIILNTREVKKFNECLVRAFGGKLSKEYAYLRNERDRIFIVSKDIAKINLKNLRIDKIGFYFAEYKNNHVRLSKEGAQLLAQEAEDLKNIVTLTEQEVKMYFTGVDLSKNVGEEDCQILLSYSGNILGCAKYKDGKILNFLPKIHRGEVIL